jgi:hypothetical protein
MSSADLVSRLGELTMIDPAACSRPELATSMRSVREIRRFLDAFEAGVARRSVELGDPAALLLSDRSRPVREVEAAVARGAVCAAMPELGSALTDGRMSAGHVDAVARIAARLDETAQRELTAMATSVVASAETATSTESFERGLRDLSRHLARNEGVDDLERLRRQRSVKRWIDRHTGMHLTQVALDPEADARVSAALDAAVAVEPDDGRTFDQRKADALVGLMTGARSGTRHRPELTALIDIDTLQHGLHGGSVCETGDAAPLPPETVRRLACDADVIPVVLDGDGVVLDVGRTRRTATAEQRTALRAVHRTCAFPACSVRFADCDVHHIVPWASGGQSDLENLLPLCTSHHHAVHEGGWQLTLHPDRHVTVRPPSATGPPSRAPAA